MHPTRERQLGTLIWSLQYILNSLPFSFDGSIQSAKHPQFQDEEMRQHSFRASARVLALFIRSLVCAGFFYGGERDIVYCFHCGIGLKNWNKEDDPWEEHAWWSPGCPFITETKGRRYVETIQQNAVFDEERCRNRTILVLQNPEIRNDIIANIEAKFQEGDITLALRKFLEHHGRRPGIEEFERFINTWEGMPARKKSFVMLIDENKEMRRVELTVMGQNRQLTECIRSSENDKRRLENDRRSLIDRNQSLEDENLQLKQQLEELQNALQRNQ